MTDHVCPQVLLDIHIQRVARPLSLSDAELRGIEELELQSVTVEDLRNGNELFHRKLSDGRLATLIPLTFNRWRINRSASCGKSYGDGWCYDDLEVAVRALIAWDPENEPEPEGWMRHVQSGRRRPDGDKAKEYVNL